NSTSTLLTMGPWCRHSPARLSQADGGRAMFTSGQTASGTTRISLTLIRRRELSVQPSFRAAVGSGCNQVGANRLFLRLSVCFLAALAAETASVMDFTPRQTRTREDGAPTVRSFFQDGNAWRLFHLAKGWRLDGGGNEAL